MGKNEAYIKNVVDEVREKYNVPAVTVNIIKSNQILYSVYDGVRVSKSSEHVTAEDFYHIGSCSKVILAYIAANLVGEGAIGWDTKLLELYPELKAEAREDYYEITLKDLLSWTAGIQAYTSGAEAYPQLQQSENQKLAFTQYLLQLEPSASRSDSGKFDYLYSNASYTIADVMLQKAAGLSYEDLLDKYIAKALGVELFIGWPYQMSRQQPWGHYPYENGSLDIIGPDIDYALNPLINAAGNLSMKSKDFARFVQHYLQSLRDQTHISQEISFIFDHDKSCACFDGSAGTFYARGYIIPDMDFGLTIIINSGSAEAVEYMTGKLLEHSWS